MAWLRTRPATEQHIRRLLSFAEAAAKTAAGKPAPTSGSDPAPRMPRGYRGGYWR
jgi:hypothetical protein